MIWSCSICNHRNLGADFPFSIKLASVNFFLILSSGASNLIFNLLRLSLLNEPIRLKLECSALNKFVPRNRTLSLLRDVSLVLVSLRFKSKLVQNSRILRRISVASSLLPLIPMIQSSAYLTYTNLFNSFDLKSMEGCFDLSAINFLIAGILPSFLAFNI